MLTSVLPKQDVHALCKMVLQHQPSDKAVQEVGFSGTKTFTRWSVKWLWRCSSTRCWGQGSSAVQRSIVQGGRSLALDTTVLGDAMTGVLRCTKSANGSWGQAAVVPAAPHCREEGA